MIRGNQKKSKNSEAHSTALLYRISKAMAAVKDGRELLKIIIAETQAIFGFYDIGLSVIDKSKLFYVDWAMLHKEISPSEANSAMTEINLEKISIDEPLFKYVFARAETENKPFIINATPEFFEEFKDFPHFPIEIEYGYKQYLVTLLKFGGETLGVLNFNSQRENHFENCDLELFQAIADLVAVAVANITANEEILERERERATLLKITEQAAKVRDFNELFTLVSGQIKPLLGFDDFVMTTFESHKQTHRVIISQSEVEKNKRINHEVFVENAHRDLSVTDDPWFADRKIYSRETPSYHTVTEMLKKYPDYFWAKMMRETGLAATITTTLKHHGKIVGGFFVHYAKELENAENLFPLIQSIANQLSTTVANILANEEILEREREKSVLLSISQAIATIQNAEQLFKVIFERIQPVFGFYDVGLFVLSKDGKQITDWAGDNPEISPSFGNQQVHQQKLQTFPFADSPLQFVGEELVRTGSPQIFRYDEGYLNSVSDVDFRAKMKTIIETGGYREFLATPLKTGGKTLGVLFFNAQTSGFFEPEKFNLFQTVADQIAVSVANILANEEILERAREKSVLLSISADIASARNAVELLQIIRDKARQLIPFYDTGILIVEDDGEHHYDLAVNLVGWENSEASRKLQALNLNRIVHPGSYVEFVMRLIEKENIPIIEDYEKRYKEFDHPFFQILEENGHQEAIVGALKSGGKTFGTLWLNSLEKNHFKPEQFEIFQALADQVAVALSNILANEEILERAREKSVLLSISENIASARNAVELMQVIRENAQQLIPFYDTGILIVEDDGAHHYDLAVNLVGWETSEPSQKLQSLNLNRIVHRGSYVEFAMRLIETANSPIIEDYEPRYSQFAYPFFEIMEQFGYQEAIVGALKSGGKTFGTLWLNSLEKNHFKPEQFEIFQALADQVAVALANILANEEILKRTNEKSVQLAVSNALTTIDDSEELIVAIAEEINKIIPNDAFSIHVRQNNPFLNLEFNDVRAIKKNGVFVPLRRRSFWKSKGISEEKLDALIREAEPVLLEKAVFTGEKYTALGQKLKLLKLISDEFGFHSVIYAPVALQNGNLVTLTASSKQANGFTPEHLEILCETGKQIALALESNLAFAEVSALKKQLEAENTYLAEEVKTAYNFAEIIGGAPPLQKVFRQIELVAPTDTTILLEGETGTGKELFARAVHDLSTRKSRPLIKINCASLPANLIESELFGHERGAFTGASERRIGKFELAHNGTIFLDEIGELPLELQAKLLRVLQEGEVERIGGKTPLKINLRVVAATNRNLRREVAEKRFRQDLYFRLNTVVLVLPSLRERREDVPALALYFAEKYGNRLGRNIRGISNKMLEALMNYEFPGNVRELEHIIEESVIFSKGETLQLHRPLKFAPDSPDASSFANILSNKSLAEIEREHILFTLKQTGGRIRGEGGAAEILQIKPTTLEARMKKLGIKKLHTNILPATK